MQHVVRTTHDFSSDDNRVGVTVEYEDGKIARITFSRKNKGYADFASMEELAQFVELASQAVEFVTPKAEG